MIVAIILSLYIIMAPNPIMLQEDFVVRYGYNGLTKAICNNPVAGNSTKIIFICDENVLFILDCVSFIF